MIFMLGKPSSKAKMDFICAAVMFLSITTCYGTKYSQDKNQQKIPDFTKEPRPYRMQKVNLLWEKAKKRLSGVKLADLYADLLVHDKHEAALKKYRSEGMDKDGLKEAHVNAAFREIIEKHGLDDLYGADGNLSNNLPLEEEKKVYYSDQKLQSMWKRAEDAGFSERDLEKLREEFWHQQMKIDEINFMKRDLDIEDITDNEVEGSKKSGKTVEQLKALNQDMKKQHKDIKSGYYNLESRLGDLDREDADFKDHRVHQLWAMAQKTNWSPKELQLFKDELRHFETRLEKHDFLENQLELSSAKLKESGGDFGHHEKHQLLEQKAQDLGFKVKKLHTDLKIRVNKAVSQHTEL